MANIIEMPKLTDTMDAGKLLSWQKSEGDAVESGESIAEVETDKASMDLEVFEDGYLRKILVQAGDKAPVGSPIAIFSSEADEDISEALAEAEKKLSGGGAKAPEPKKEAPKPVAQAPEPKKEAPKAAAPKVSAPPRNESGRLLASPLALRMAAEARLDLASIQGSGPGGRVIKRDIEKAQADASSRRVAAPAAASAPAPAPAASRGPQATLLGMGRQEIPGDLEVTSMRATIARRLSESKNGIPHYYVTMDIDMEAAVEAREALKSRSGARVSLNDMVVKAAALALTRHPLINASWRDDVIEVKESVDIGVAVALEEGLITPIVRGADRKGLMDIANEIRELAGRAKNRKLKPEEFTGGSFTISNLGMFGVSDFTAIINPPEAAILAVGGVRDEPVVKDGAIVPGKRMKITMSSDHRVIDGAMAARFLQTVKEILENPISLAL